MHLYLMQHGLAVPEQEDPEEPLSPEGVAQIQAVGRVRLDGADRRDARGEGEYGGRREREVRPGQHTHPDAAARGRPRPVESAAAAGLLVGEDDHVRCAVGRQLAGSLVRAPDRRVELDLEGAVVERCGVSPAFVRHVPK